MRILLKTNKTRIPIVILLIFFTSCVSTKSNYDFLYSIQLTSCFYNDPVSLSINDITVMDNKKLTSDELLGFTPFILYVYKSGKLILSENGQQTKTWTISLESEIKLVLTKNGYRNLITLKKNKGKIVDIHGCHDSEGEKVTVRYFKKDIIFD